MWLAELAPDQQEAFERRAVTVRLQIAVKEILEHLRSALDYCARELCERATGVAPPAGIPVYFPIAARGFDRKDFRSRVGKCLPGLLASREDLVSVLESFQEFASLANRWLPDLATLCNENKHERLSAQRGEESAAQVQGFADGWQLAAIRPCDTPKLGEPSCLGFVPLKPSGSVGGEYLLVYFTFEAIGEEVETFLRNAVEGVGRVVEELRANV